MSIPVRIKELIQEKKMNVSSFEKKIGVGNNSIGTIILKDSNVSGSILSKILNEFKDISADWLLTGTGEMLRGNQESQQSGNDIAKFMQSKNVFKEIFERLEKIEEIQDNLVISQVVNEEIATIIEKNQNQVLEKK